MQICTLQKLKTKATKAWFIIYSPSSLQKRFSASSGGLCRRDESNRNFLKETHLPPWLSTRLFKKFKLEILIISGIKLQSRYTVQSKRSSKRTELQWSARRAHPLDDLQTKSKIKFKLNDCRVGVDELETSHEATTPKVDSLVEWMRCSAYFV